MYMNLAPVLFPDVKIIRHPGYNFAFWNVHERELTRQDNTYFVNRKYPLVFIHFAKFNPLKPGYFTDPRHFNRIKHGENALISEISESYAKRLIDNHYNEYKNIRSVYSKSRFRIAYDHSKNSGDLKTRFKYLLIALGNLLPDGIINTFRKMSLSLLRNLR